MGFNIRFIAVTAITVNLATLIYAHPTKSEKDQSVGLSERQDASTDAFRFWGYNGCNTPEHPDWSSDILHAWDEVLDIGNSVTSDVDWTSDVAADFLGSPNDNKDYQEEIQRILKNIQTWRHDGTILAWSIEARCDDYLRRPELGCPKGTAPEDQYKCGSRCWQPRTRKDDTNNDVVYRWDARAAAYTTNHKSTDVATINFCPSFFAMDTCQKRVDTSGKSTNDHEKFHMQNYQCRGYTALHELFHIDAMAHRVAYRVNHVYDRKFRIWSPYDKKLVTRSAYGPEFTKTLANWSKDTGKWVATNADNLAQYALAMWVTGKIGGYPFYPIVSEKPREEPFAIGTLSTDGKISLSDNSTALGEALGVAPEDAFDTYVDGELSCSDAGGSNATIGDPCVDDANNAPADLFLKSDGTNTPIPPPTSNVPADFNCNCGENGCSVDSMPCCANRSCQCHCTENGCAAEDPSCCANGTCHV